MSTTLKEVIQAAVTQAVADAKLAAHPIGSLYWSTQSTDPASLFGGMWTRVKDVFVLAAGDTYTAGATGGEPTHTLTEAEMPAHSHIDFPGGSTHYITISPSSIDSFGGTGFANGDGFAASNPGSGWWFERYKKEQVDNLKGNSQPHNNMPPYIAAYCWKRTA